jgi:3-deoxy-D-arabino-heptulosonate 7-phosphate (DAHP) synthase
MKKREIVIVAGPCAVESEEQITDIGYKISQIRNIAQNYHIQFKLRGGAWKPRTLFFEKGQKVFTGMKEQGLQWLSKIGHKYNLPIVTEIMSETTIDIFKRYLRPSLDYLQIGARTSQAFTLLESVGKTQFGVLLKNPLHGIQITETIGSLQRFVKNSSKIFCVRGQKIINPILQQKGYHKYLHELIKTPHQHPDARYLNNIEAVHELRSDSFFQTNKILFCYDPSHVWGGRTDFMKQKIGMYAIKAIRDFQYDWIIVEVDDHSAQAICDADQAILTTTNNIQWSETSYGQEPQIKPITLVDITCHIMAYQSEKMRFDSEKLQQDITTLNQIKWTASKYR